ncbi:MAG: proteasome assembly chaperone family protein [Candidatus Nanohaloarchaea archaeon]
MTTEITVDEELDLENPLLIEGLAGIGHVGRNCVSYLSEKLGAEQVGIIDSHHFPPYTIVEDDKSLTPLQNQIYHLELEDRDVVMIEGNAQASSAEGHYEIAHRVLDFADEIGVEEIITIGGYGKGDVVEEPEVFGAVTSQDVKSDYTNYGISFDHDVGQIVGISGLLLGLGEQRGKKGIALLGETPGFLMSDPKSTEAVLQVMEQILDVDLDYSDLDEKVEESQEVLKKLQNLKGSQEADDQQQQGSDLGYIG